MIYNTDVLKLIKMMIYNTDVLKLIKMINTILMY